MPGLDQPDGLLVSLQVDLALVAGLVLALGDDPVVVATGWAGRRLHIVDAHGGQSEDSEQHGPNPIPASVSRPTALPQVGRQGQHQRTSDKTANPAGGGGFGQFTTLGVCHGRRTQEG